MSKKLGKNCKLYIDTTDTLIATADQAGVAARTWSEVTPVKDVKLTNSWDTWEGTTRGSGTVKEVYKTFSDRSITIDLVYDSSNTYVMALVNASYAETVVPVLAMRDGSNSTAGNTGVAFNAQVTAADENQALTEGVTFSLTLSPAVDSKWTHYTVGT